MTRQEQKDHTDRAWHWTAIYQMLVESEAPEDTQRAALYWLRESLRLPGDPDVMLEQALTAQPVSRMRRKP